MCVCKEDNYDRGPRDYIVFGVRDAVLRQRSTIRDATTRHNPHETARNTKIARWRCAVVALGVARASVLSFQRRLRPEMAAAAFRPFAPGRALCEGCSRRALADCRAHRMHDLCLHAPVDPPVPPSTSLLVSARYMPLCGSTGCKAANAE
eukprot:556019-Prymnesium_polylepis.1